MENTAARLLMGKRLRFSRNPAAMVVGAALDAMRATGLEDGQADYVIIAVPLGAAPAAYKAATAAVKAVPDPEPPRPPAAP